MVTSNDVQDKLGSRTNMHDRIHDCIKLCLRISPTSHILSVAYFFQPQFPIPGNSASQQGLQQIITETHCVPGTALGMGNPAGSKTDKHVLAWPLCSSGIVGERMGSGYTCNMSND